ncbi:hypothetical protein FBQ96_08820 [Nitrospirales bacterium NOB]|nr:hypothetical protein [Nitrospirales bacterium NOB]
MDINATYHPQLRSDHIKAQLNKLEALEHQAPVTPSCDQFDAETIELLTGIYGDTHQYVESYKYATLGEAEAIVNLPEFAQEPQTRDVPKKGLQQRRQLLLGILTDIEELEASEAEVLAGEDREDPPGMS